MYYTVKTLLETGKSISEVARELGIDRKTVRKIRDKVKDGVKVPATKRRSIIKLGKIKAPKVRIFN